MHLRLLMTEFAACTSHFTGKERDAESGLDYFGARYNSSSMGRFLSPDWSAKEDPVPYAKLDDPQTLNLYDYVRGNPLSGLDADGHQDSNCTCAQGPSELNGGFPTPTRAPSETIGQTAKAAVATALAALGHAVNSLMFAKENAPPASRACY
jgi:RHS repeat-associated protein